MKENMEIKDVVSGVKRSIKDVNQEVLTSKVNYLLMNYKVSNVFQDGNFTTVVLSDGTSFYVGTAKRNPADRNVPKRGKFLALSRAVRAALVAETRDHSSHLIVV